MTIEYIPERLGEMVNDSHAPRRLRNRQGDVVCNDCHFSSEGNVLDINLEAKVHLQEFPEHHLVVKEISCRFGM